MRYRIVLLVLVLAMVACGLGGTNPNGNQKAVDGQRPTEPRSTERITPDEADLRTATATPEPSPEAVELTFNLVDWGNLGGESGFVDMTFPGGDLNDYQVTIQGLEPPAAGADAPVSEWIPYGPTYEGEEQLISEGILRLATEDYLNSKYYIVRISKGAEEIGEARFKMGAVPVATNEGASGGGGSSSGSGGGGNLTPDPTDDPGPTGSS